MGLTCLHFTRFCWTSKLVSRDRLANQTPRDGCCCSCCLHLLVLSGARDTAYIWQYCLGRCLSAPLSCCAGIFFKDGSAESGCRTTLTSSDTHLFLVMPYKVWQQHTFMESQCRNVATQKGKGAGSTTVLQSPVEIVPIPILSGATTNERG